MPLGTNFDDFLQEEGTFETTTAAAVKKVLAWQIEEEMKAQHLTKPSMAKRMRRSAAAGELFRARASSCVLSPEFCWGCGRRF